MDIITIERIEGRLERYLNGGIMGSVDETLLDWLIEQWQAEGYRVINRAA